MSNTASGWNANVPAPDLSNVLQLATQAGRNAGLNDFYAALAKQRQAAINKAQAANKAAAKSAQASNPSGSGFWHSLGQFALSGLQHTMDLLSSFDYASANAMNYLVSKESPSNSYDNSFAHKLVSHLNPLGVDWLSVAENFKPGDVGGLANAAVKGFEGGFGGKTKTTYADVIANAGKKDSGKGYLDNPVYQGIAGLAGDIILDPSTYIGLGIISKPMRAYRAGEEMAKALDASKSADPQLVNDVANLGLTRKAIGKDGQVTEVPLRHDVIRAMLGDVRKGHHMGKAATTKKAVEQRIHGLEDLKKAIRNSPVGLDKTQAVKDLEAAIAEHTTQLNESLNTYAKNVYKREFAKAKAGKAGDLKQATQEADKILTEAVTTHQLAKFARLSKELATTKSVARANTIKAEMTQVMGHWFNSPALSNDFRKNLMDSVDTIVEGRKTVDKSGRIKRVGGDKRYGELRKKAYKIRQDIQTKSDVLQALKRGTADYQNTYTEINRARTALDHTYNQMAMIKGEVMKNMIRHQLGHIKVSGKVAGEFNKLVARQKEIQDQIHAIAPAGDNQSTVVAGQFGSNGNNELKSLQNEWNTNNQRINEILQNEYKSQGRITRPGPGQDTTSWDQAVQNQINEKAAKLEQSLIRSATQARKETKTGVPKELKGMFGGNRDKEPIITIDGKTVAKNMKSKPILRKHITEADKRLAEEYNAAFANTDIKTMAPTQTKTVHIYGKQYNVTKHIGYVEIKNGKKELAELQTLTPSNVTIVGDNVRIATEHPVTIAPEYVAFDRMFREQHGMRIQDAVIKRDHLEGKVVPVGSEKKLMNRPQFVHHAWEDPQDVAFGFGIRIPFRGSHKVQWQAAKRLGATAKEWSDAVEHWFNNAPLEDINKELMGAWDAAYRKQVRENATKFVSHDKINYKKIKQEAYDQAAKDVHAEINKTNSIVDINGIANPVHVPTTTISPAELHNSALAQEADRYAQAKAAERLAKERANPTKARKELAAKLDKLKQEHEATVKALGDAYHEAKKAREEMLNRLDEQTTINLIQTASESIRPHLAITAGGVAIKHLEVPIPKVLLAATENLGKLKIIQAANKAWSEAFTPASKLEHELNEARLLAQNRTPELIKHDIDQIRHDFQNHTLDERKNAFKLVRKGMPAGDNPDPLVKKVMDSFDQLSKYYNGTLQVGDSAVTASKMNRYLSDTYKISYPKYGSIDNLDLSTGQKILANMKNLPEGVDPAEVLFRLHIAAQQTMSRMALESTIKNTFGIKRVFRLDKKQPPSETELLIESLRDRHGWVTNTKWIGDTHYFPPDVNEQINKLMKMMEPHESAKVTQLYDKILRIWKSSVTIYNPGYYTRNGIGEAMMSMFDGVGNPRHYAKAAQILNYAMPDEVNQALKTLEPWKKFATPAQLGAKKVTRLKDGRQLSAEEVWLLYHQSGLKSGFISTEYEHYFPTLGSLKSSPVGRTATKINDAMRKGGEKYEDYFRLAHFISRLERSNYRNVEEAATEAARYVRKYHFDYTDFTPFEKSVMMRVFPFYKWTRKAVPLMASMIFTRPGLVMVYPKAMTGISYASGGVKPLQDKNGFYPNYEKIVPIWMKSMMAYPIGRDQQNAMDYMNIANPQFDIYKMLRDPAGTMFSMLSPGIKVPMEQLAGTTLDPGFQQKLKTKGDRIQEIARTSPQANFISKIIDSANPKTDPKTGKLKSVNDNPITEPGAPMDEVLTSFLTGLGVYENNKNRQKGEIYRRYMQQNGL